MAFQNTDFLLSACNVRKKGDVVWINYAGDAINIESGEWKVLFELPEAFRPELMVHSIVRSSFNAVIRVDTSGRVSYYTTTPTSQRCNFQFSFCYFTK